MERKMQHAAVAAAILVLAFSIGAPSLFAQEHPSEHPTKKGQAAPAQEVTKEAIAGAITAYVNEEAAEHEGFFPLHDDEEGKDLSLTLEKVHDDRLATISSDTHFACADFKSKEGTMYDLDFFVKGTSPDKLEVIEVFIHKKDGKERYLWVEEGGVWMKKELEE